MCLAIASSITALASYWFSRGCGWAGSHIEVKPMPADASLGQSMQGATRTMFQGISNNAGWLAFVALLPFVYVYAREKEDPKDVQSKDIIKGIAQVALPVAGAAILLSKASGSLGSRI